MKTILPFLLALFALDNLIAQNVGIGNTNPAYPLDVSGRMRLRHSGQSAGIWLDGNPNTLIGFMGVYDNNTIGLYGTVSGWQMVLNTNTGQVGVGTLAPTAKLDVNGDFRLRGNFPVNGSVLVSKDANGNTAWQKVYAFRAQGLESNADVVVGVNTTSKIIFSNITAFNIGLPFNGITSSFITPVKGIYSFMVRINIWPTQASTASSLTLELMRTRNNVTTVLSSDVFGIAITGDVQSLRPLMTRQVGGDFSLEANDEVWVRVRNGVIPHNIYGSIENASFCGHLVAQQF